jgi:nitrogen regulatory protein PII
MKSIKRIEIVVGSIETKRVISLLEDNGIEEYTLIRNVLGKGDRGDQDGEGLHDAFLNNYILIGCSESEFEKIKEPIRNLLGQIGGVCLVSDALWLQH